MAVVLPQSIQRFLLNSTQADALLSTELIQSLWSGYGKIVRCHLTGSNRPSVILKWVHPQSEKNHPRGWNTSTSHQRKLRSYQIELHWYKNWADQCPSSCRIPQYLASEHIGEDSALLLEDLDASGFSGRKNHLEGERLAVCLDWLAAFHARFIQAEADGLWPIGSYWHFATRQEEWQNMPSGTLKRQARYLDEALSSARYQTIIHGDAKLANFCFALDDRTAAALDFQYAGAGVGVKDLAYLLGSCLDNEALFEWHEWCLDRYFSQLKVGCEHHIGVQAYRALEEEWRGLYSVAVADFARFLEGWNPGHWKLNAYTEYHVQAALR